MNIGFSVLMSIYCKENPKFLHECLKSIWDNQTLKPNQIVLVKDGELTDELEKIIQDWQNKLKGILKIVPLLQNVGLAKALNAGLEHCEHEWVFRMDTDDICMSDRFQKQIDFIKANPSIVLFGGQVQEFNQQIDDLKMIKSVPISHEQICHFATKRNPFNHMTIAYKKLVILSLDSYQHHWFMEDYNLWLRVIGNGYQVSNLSDILVYARVGNGMHGRRRGWQYIKSEWQLFQLKNQLNVHGVFYGGSIFILRTIPRLLPQPILGLLYRLLRKR
ncbi:putative glycosyl transferase [Moraxella lacunata]|uniref:Putative glycosyl transferase n=1 Tax=Moraxella lacunata TaxID=477 RepID=A0A378QHH8_MORLA|nr:glycosyltransferase [Moraxella lacunata]STZ00349.1 putative glycosyl transferase [Moraxella lacunata]